VGARPLASSTRSVHDRALTSLLFFFYSREHKGSARRAGAIGIVFLMVSFGAGYGYTVMSRVSLLIGRFQFLIEDWLGMK
jgi:hypothetical protein